MKRTCNTEDECTCMYTMQYETRIVSETSNLKWITNKTFSNVSAIVNSCRRETWLLLRETWLIHREKFSKVSASSIHTLGFIGKLTFENFYFIFILFHFSPCRSSSSRSIPETSMVRCAKRKNTFHMWNDFRKKHQKKKVYSRESMVLLQKETLYGICKIKSPPKKKLHVDFRDFHSVLQHM